MSNLEMVIDRVDENDEIIGTITRRDVFRMHAGFRVVHVLLYNLEGQLLLQRLADSRERHPGCWGSSVAAYLFAGEGYEEAAERRLREELDIRNTRVDAVGKFIMQDQGTTKHVALFSARTGVVPSPDPKHISEIRFATIPEVISETRSHPGSFTPTFLRIVDYLSTRESRW